MTVLTSMPDYKQTFCYTNNYDYMTHALSKALALRHLVVLHE